MMQSQDFRFPEIGISVVNIPFSGLRKIVDATVEI